MIEVTTHRGDCSTAPENILIEVKQELEKVFEIVHLKK